MAAPGEDRIPLELTERWESYVDLSRKASFQRICAQESGGSPRNSIEPYFVTWRTSLMGSSLDKLKNMATDDHLRAFIKALIVEDDSESLDPYGTSELPSATSTYDIWPRGETGAVVSSDISGFAELTAMLREGKLRPETIKFRDYQIAEHNLGICPEFIRVRDQIKKRRTQSPSRGTIAALARDIIGEANLAVASLVIQYADFPTPANSILDLPRFAQADTFISLGSPNVTEAIIGLSVVHQGEDVGFSLLHSAVLLLAPEATSYWIDQIFYHAPALQSLKLSTTGPWSTPLDAAQVVPKFTDLELSGVHISAEALTAMLACSRATLTCLRLRQVTLEEGSTWRELLSFIGGTHQALTSFSLRILREGDGGSMAVDYRGLKKSDVPEECRSGLDLIEMGPVENKRVTRLSYSGPNASSVLDIVSRFGREGIPNEGTRVFVMQH